MNSSAFPAQLLSSFPAFLAMFRKVNAFPSSTAEEKKKKGRKRRNVNVYLEFVVSSHTVTFLRSIADF